MRESEQVINNVSGCCPCERRSNNSRYMLKIVVWKWGIPLTSFFIIVTQQKATTAKTWRLRKRYHHYTHIVLRSPIFPAVKPIYFQGPILRSRVISIWRSISYSLPCEI